MNINLKQLPIKTHFFFFMAAMGPILPFLPVIGKQIGISPLIFGSISAILPIAVLIAKPTFGILVDYYYEWRKTIFITLLAFTTICFSLMNLLPYTSGLTYHQEQFSNMTYKSFNSCHLMNITSFNQKDVSCFWNCGSNNKFTTSMIFFGSETYGLDNTCFQSENQTYFIHEDNTCNVTCEYFEKANTLYSSPKFWGFVFLMSLGNIGFNVANCISDAICFDILGEHGQMGYGRQRVWGTIGFGISAFLAGFALDTWSKNETMKDYTPAFIIALAFSFIDLFCCKKLQLPHMSGTESILKDVYKLIRLKPIAIFLIFATIAGIMDSFLIYFLFWYMEDLAMQTGYMGSIKLIEGCTVAAQTLFGEVVFFTLAGKILKKVGFGLSLTFCFLCYGLRLGLISIAPTPWMITVIELFMQGPTYALCYTTIVAYASKISPPGTSATVQGIVAGMDDGLGFAIGSLIGGILYKNFGGILTMRIFSFAAIVTSIAYLGIYLTYLKHSMPETDVKKTVEFKSPEEAMKECN